MKEVYLDNNATTQCAPAVVEAMLPFFTENYGNASSMHTFGGSNRRQVETARQQVAALLNAQYADEIIFTSCATESDNTAVFSAARSFPHKKHLITSAVEHPAIMEPYKYLEFEGRPNARNTPWGGKKIRRLRRERGFWARTQKKLWGISVKFQDFRKIAWK